MPPTPQKATKRTPTEPLGPRTFRTPREVFASKPIAACGFVALLMGAAYVVPGAERLRLLSPKRAEVSAVPAASDLASAHVGEAPLVDETRDQPELATPLHPELIAQARSGPTLADPSATGDLPRSLQDPSGQSLDAFFASLMRAEQGEGGAIARVVHYGDSLLAVDYVSGTLRRRLQERFGDAGHGYMPIANPWPGYFHNDVRRRATTEWTVSRVVGPFAPDDLYGLGGVSFVGRTPGAWATYATAAEGEFGRSVSRFGVQYLEQPGGGAFEVTIDRQPAETVTTEGPTLRLVERVFSVSDGAHDFKLQVAKGPVRAFGTWMERDVPGVVLDSIGIQGGRLRFLDKSNDEHWAEALRLRKPSLIVFEFGLNESADGFAYPMDRYRETSAQVLRQVRSAVPDASCLVIAPNDVATKQGTAIVSRPVMPQLVQAQQDVAIEVGCAFFNTYEAMGGLGSMATWIGRGLGQPDLTHPTTVGADIIAGWVFRDLMKRYEAYRVRVAGDGAPDAGASSG